MKNPALERIPTGVLRLDTLLKGGLYAGGLYVIQGAPGMGKTILANQIGFEQAKKGHCVFFYSLMAESSGRAVSYLSTFSFVNQDVIGREVQFVSGYSTLREKGPEGFLNLLKETVTKAKAKILVIDGIDAIEAKTTTEIEYREFIHALQIFASVTNCTTILLTPKKQSASGEARPEHAISDGVIELSEHLVGPRAIREIQILKFRGSGFLKGRHEIEISDDGLIVHPRTEVQFGQTLVDRADEARTRMGFGVINFDAMLQGGLLSGSMTSLIGSPGTGKTTLGLSFLSEGAKKGEPGIYFGFYEPPQRLLEKADSVGLSLGKAVESGMVQIQWQQAVENIADGLAERLLETIRAHKSKKLRIFIDGMNGFRKALPYPERFGPFLSALTNELRNIGATTIYADETEIFSSDIELKDRELGSVVDNIIFLRYVELRSQLFRLISILKMRESAYDTSIREFVIGKNGVEVSCSFESAEAILTGHPRVLTPMQAETDRPVK